MSAPSLPFDPVGPQPRVFVPVPIDPAGRTGPTRTQARRQTWRRVAENLVVPARVDSTRPDQRAVEGAARLPPGGALTGWAALLLMRAAFFDGRARDGTLLRVPLAVGDAHGRRSHPGIELSYERLAPEEVLVLHGVPLVRPERALFYEMRRPGPEREAVVAADMALAARLVTPAMIERYLETHRSWRRSSRVAWALPHTDAGSRSPAETRLRLVYVLDAGLPPPHVNREVFDLDGRLVCIPDLFDEEAGMVVEYDGAQHRGAGRHTRDVAREEACRRVGLEYCKVTGLDLHRVDTVVERLHAVRDRAAFLPPGRRRWTLDYPRNWSPFPRFPT